MKPGHGSKTAVLVCMGRALADGDPAVPRFRDATAMALLPYEARARVQRARSSTPPKNLRAAIDKGYLTRQSKVMAARTLAIDDVVRDAAAPQLVILGAGLDGRAWRMPELADVTVFEVDHPDSQREKRARLGALTQMAHDVRFVPVDFARDDLDDALAKAGHDPARPTTWIWEGVVMYLTLHDIETTLAVLERRSAPGSHLTVLYHHPALILRLVGALVRRLGEPLRSSFRPEAMRALLARYRFDTVRDQDLVQLGATISRELAKATRVARHLRLATAVRR